MRRAVMPLLVAAAVAAIVVAVGSAAPPPGVECSAYELTFNATGSGTLGQRFAFEATELLTARNVPPVSGAAGTPSTASHNDTGCMALCDAAAQCVGVVVVDDAHYQAPRGSTCYLVNSTGRAVETSLTARSYARTSNGGSAAIGAPGSLQVWLTDAATHVFQDDPGTGVRYCNKVHVVPNAGSPTMPTVGSVALAGAPSFTASAQLVLRDTSAQHAASGITVAFTDLHMVSSADATSISSDSSIPASALSWRQVGYVQANATHEYDAERPYGPTATGGGSQAAATWYPDPLVAPPAAGVDLNSNVTQPLWLSVTLPRGSAPGNYSGTMTVSSATAGPLFTASIDVTLWDVGVASIDDSMQTFLDAWGFDTDALRQEYKALSPPAFAKLQATYFAELCAHRTPPSHLATSLAATRPLAEVDFILRNISSGGCGEPLFNAYYVSSSANASAAYVAQVIAAMTPRMEVLGQAGLLSRAMVYGFDESLDDHAPALRALFGAIKAKWPQVHTMAVLPWPPTVDMPLDIWTVQYGFLDAGFHHPPFPAHTAADFQAAAAAFRAAGKQVIGYHCISPRGNSPSGNDWLNTFLDVSPLQARVLRGWVPALHQLDGWLYWYSNWGMGHPGGNAMNRSAKVAPLVALDSMAHATYNPTIFSGTSTTAFSNEDGNVIYAGPGGPVSSQRLELLRLGAQDSAVLRLLPRDAVLPLIDRVVRSGMDATNDAAVVEAAIAEAAGML